jgi:transposase
MDDVRCREFFFHPENTYHRCHEALQAVFVEGRPQKEVAQQFELRPDTVRHWVGEFREHCGKPRKMSPFSRAPLRTTRSRDTAAQEGKSRK